MDLDYVNISDLGDTEVVAHMRKVNYEQFKRLVRMHLSFELDLNTDEFDLPCHEIVYEDKGKLKKWNRLSKKHKLAPGQSSSGCSAAAGGCGPSSKGGAAASADNSPSENFMQQQASFMYHLDELKEFLLLEKNLNQEGIFRKTGSVSRQNELRLKIQSDSPLELEDGGYSAHDCATVFKGYLADLPEPLLTDAHYPAHLQIAPLCLGVSAKCSNPERLKRHEHLLNSVQLLLLLLPDDNRQLLQHVIEILHTVIGYEKTNKMGPDNLATLFAPHLICPRKLPPEALHYVAKKMSSIVAYMIVKGDEIFEVPAKLSTDIRAYFLERKRKKTMSPEQTLDESISDMSTVNTVYTFVDRERTAAAHTKNNTDTELAHLYAHIQSLPESSKKRRLIKQFNKQNGQGTPLQLVVKNSLKTTDATRSAKSISDSIKKHIFHMGIMSRTPKRQPGAGMHGGGIETPNYSNAKNPKMRVLFQSPAPSTPLTSANSTASHYHHHHHHHHHQQQQQHHHAHTPLHASYLKTHALQKSSTTPLYGGGSLVRGSLHQKFAASAEESVDSVECLRADMAISSSSSSSCHSNSNSGSAAYAKKCQSAPVSRQVSSDLHGGAAAPSSPTASSVTPLKLLSDVAKQLITGNPGGAGASGGSGKKSNPHWDEDDGEDDEADVDPEEEAEDEDEVDHYNSQPCTPLQQAKHSNNNNKKSSDLKSRYKSEPNLSRISKERAAQKHTDADGPGPADTGSSKSQEATTSQPGKSLTRKLMKGVSMGNLKFPSFGTPDSRRRLNQRRGSAEPPQSCRQAAVAPEADVLDDLDDDTFEDDPQDQLDSSSSGSSCSHVDAAPVEGDGDEGGAAADDSTLSENGLRPDGDLDDGEESSEMDRTRLPDEAGGSSSELPGDDTSNASAASSGCGGHSSLRRQYQQQQSSLYRNLDLITSTPSLLLGRRSMSPITKSTQRMPKAMQESIMTPRSRKPVMVLTTTTLNSTDQNQTIYQNDLSSFREQDEEENLLASPVSKGAADAAVEPILHNENATSLGGYADILRRQHLLQANQSFVAVSGAEYSCSSSSLTAEGGAANGAASELTNNFKEYLLSRSVLTASPVDSSFASQPDDFDSSSSGGQDVEEIAGAESQLSTSLLYCLDGNQPDALEEPAAAAAAAASPRDLVVARQQLKSKNGGGGVGDAVTTSPILASNMHRHNRLASNPFVIMNNARKRAASSELEKSPDKTKSTTPPGGPSAPAATTVNSPTSRTPADNKENCDQLAPGTSSGAGGGSSFVLSRKLLITEYPGETSF